MNKLGIFPRRRLNERGMTHLLVPLLVIIIVAATGGYVLLKAIRAASVSYEFKSGISGKCLDVWHDGNTNGTVIDSYACNNTAAQQWMVNTNGTIEDASEKCLDNWQQKSTNGNPIKTYTCSPTDPAEQWQLTGNTLKNSQTNKCIDDPAFSTTNGKPLELYTCTGGSNQKWVKTALSSGTGTGSGTGTASPSGTVVTNGSSSAITDSSGKKWTVTGGFIYENGTKAPYAMNVIEIAYVDGTVWQENANNLWWSWNGTGWNGGTGITTSPLPGGGGNTTGSGGSGSGSNPSGAAMPTGNLPGFRQIYATDFSKYTVPLGDFSNCNPSTLSCSGLSSSGGLENYLTDYPDGWTDTEGNNNPNSPGRCYYYPSETLSVAGGALNMFIHTDSSNRCVTAVPEPILPKADQSSPNSNAQLYGEYSVRMRSDALPNYLVAFLLWPANQNWPHDGEIDFPNSELTGTVSAFMHHEGGTSGGDQDAYSSNTTYAGWHTYTTIWTPSYVKFEIDGTVIGDSTNRSEIPDTPMYWVLQTEGDISTTKPNVNTKGNLQVAWATVYAYDPSVN